MRNIQSSDYVLVLATACFCFLFSCAAPDNPFEDRNNVDATITVLTPLSDCIVGDSVQFLLKVDLLDFIDSVQVIFSDGPPVTVKSSEISSDWTKEIFHIYIAPGNDSVFTKIYENNNTQKKKYQTIVTIKTYLIYNANGSDSGSVPVDSTLYEKGQTVTIKANSNGLVKTDHVFSGWNTEPDGSGSAYGAGSDNYIVDSLNILYARWTQNPTYIVTYNGNGNTSGTVPVDSNSYENGVGVTLLGNTGILAKTNYTFAGWNTQADGNGATYLVSSILTINSANVVLYVKWTQNPTYTVVYNGNGNLGGRVPLDLNAYESDDSVTVKSNSGNLTKTGYAFVGWNTVANGTGIWYAVGTVFTIATSNVVLYAQWTTSPTYKVVYSGNGNTGGSVPVDANAYKANSIVTVRANTGSLVKTNYYLAGWNTAADGSGTTYSAAGTTTFEIGQASVVLYAKWAMKIIILPPIL